VPFFLLLSACFLPVFCMFAARYLPSSYPTCCYCCCSWRGLTWDFSTFLCVISNQEN
jgi:hypothetical protein